jgi:HipA-like protein
MKKQFSVRLNSEQVGILEQTPAEKLEFNYDDSATKVISTGMSISEDRCVDKHCERHHLFTN